MIAQAEKQKIGTDIKKKIAESDNYCTKCGQSLVTDWGHSIHIFCPQCGTFALDPTLEEDRESCFKRSKTLVIDWRTGELRMFCPECKSYQSPHFYRKEGGSNVLYFRRR